MKRLAILDIGKLEIQEYCEEVKVKPNMVKVKVNACGVCGSDLSLLQGKRDLKNEHYFGHEFTGIVTEIGDGVTGVELGMRVTSELVKTCGQCWNCRNGSPNYCKSLNEVLFPGGFASETIVLHSDSYKFLSILPTSIDDIMGTLVEPTNCALRVVKRSKIQPGQSVLVIGLGSMGIIVSQLLGNFGAGKIIGMDKNKSRLETVKKSGLIDVINRNDLDWLEQLKNYTGTRGVDVVIEATGFPVAIGDAFLAARVGGLISVLSVYHEKANNLDILPIMRKELTIVGAKGPYPDQKSDDTSVAVGELQKIQEKLRKIIRIYDFKDSFKAFDDAIKGISIKSVISFKNM